MNSEIEFILETDLKHSFYSIRKTWKKIMVLQKR